MKTKKIPVFVLYFVTIFLLEILFKIFSVGHFWTISWVYIFFYDGFLAFLFSSLTKIFSEKINRILTFLCLFLFTGWMCAEVLFRATFQVYFSFATTFFADQAISFGGKIFEILFQNWWVIALLFLPFVLALLFQKYFSFQTSSKRNILSSFALCGISYALFWGFLIFSKSDLISPYELYTGVNNNALNKETFGAIPATFIELRKMILPPKEKFYPIDSNEEEKSEEKIYEKNILDIPFSTYYENETDEQTKQMHEYFMNDPGTTQNEYTGYFEDKNLILFMAESFNSIAVDPVLTPTLYQLTHEGFVFENFYSPVILSTIGGEFQELTGLYPNLSMLSNVWRQGKNEYPFGLGTMFAQKNYEVRAYHDHKYNFQNRNVYLKSLGFTNYMGCFNGLETRMNCQAWPESDDEMIQATLDDYVHAKNPFFTYYVTVSGHMSYNFSSNQMARKHQSEVEGLSYSTDIKAYLASQIELDRALASLIKGLQENGKLENTVIALVADHYPYDIPVSHINEVAKRDATIEINRSYFLLWNASMPTISISKVGGNMDVLPTLLNLFGMDYDSRLLMGKDLFSDDEGLVIFADASWRTNQGRFYASTKTFEPEVEMEDADRYVEQINQVVSNRINLSKLILEKNYYQKVLGD